MSDPTGLEGRLRDALGGEDPPGPGCAERRAGLATARARVLAGIRRRRMRRLQLAGGAAVVVLGLALGLPQVLGSAAPTSPTSPLRSKSAAPPRAPEVHGATAGPNRASQTSTVAACRVRGRTISGCGTLQTGSAARALGATATSSGKAADLGTSRTSQGLGSPLTVRAGRRVVVDLPAVERDWRWSTPSVVGTSVHDGQAPPVTVRPTSASTRGATQQFLVTTDAPVTLVLEAEDDVYTGPGPPRSAVVSPTAVWVLELEVEAG